MTRVSAAPALCALLVAAAGPAFAQDLVKLLRADLRAQKKVILTQAMDLDAAQAKRFWPLYGEYESDLGRIDAEVERLIEDYTANHDRMTDRTAKDMVKRSIKVLEARTRLLKKYAGKMEKTVSPKVAARWVQVEHVIQAALDLQVAQELPLLR